MKRLPSRAAFLLYLMGIFLTGDIQVSALPVQKRGLFPAKESLLDMATASFDDQYKGCVEATEAKLDQVNQTEFAANRLYAEAWREASSRWGEKKASLSLAKGLKPEHAIALLAYTTQGGFHKEFNRAVREAGRTRETYLRRFNFKTFHFLLTRALRLLKASSHHPRCRKVYRGVRNVHFVSQGHKPVRFGHFASSSLRNQSALRFGTDTFFTIETCHGVNIQNFSFFPGEEEVLIPPFEKFKVANFTRGRETTFIHLLSLEDDSAYNCVLAKEKKCKTQGPCSFTTGASWSLFTAKEKQPLLFLLFLLLTGAFGPAWLP